MNKFYTLAIAAIISLGSSAQQIQLVGENDRMILISCSPQPFNHDVVNTANGDAWLITIPDATPLLKTGAPDLPKLTVALAVDDKAQMEVNIVESHYTDIQNVLVAPSKGNLLRTIDPATVPYQFGEQYDQDAFYPQQPAALGQAYIEGVVRGQSLHFYPIQYNPVTHVLRVYDYVVVNVIPTDVVGENALPEETSTQVNEVMNEVYMQHYINYMNHVERYDVVSELGNMLVITDAEYMEELAPWVQWKKEKGIPTEVVDIADIGNTTTLISNYVEDYYDDNGLTYLVLVGDEDQITSPLLNNSGGQGYCDPCYGQIDGNDSYAEVFVGRFLVHNDAELVPFINKTIEYEKNPYTAADWFSIGAGIGSNEGEGYGDDDEADWQHQNDLKEKLLDYTYTEVWELYDGNHTAASPTGGTTADGTGSPSAASLSAIINDGCSLINYTGHGSHSSIATCSFTNTHIDALTNAHKYPFFIIVGCCVGDFDDDDASGDTFGERWIKATDAGDPAGGIGGAFSSVYQSWAPPMEGQDEMNHIITEMVNYETRHTLATIVNHGCSSMNDEYGQDGDDMTDTWILMADPTVQLRTAYPTSLVVDHPAVVFLGTDQITVDCETEDAMVCLSMNGEILGTAIVTGGQVTISFPAVNDLGIILVTVSSFNTIPYQEEIEVTVVDGPWVVDETEVLDDTNGNNNGQADYNESVMLDVSLENVGIEVASEVSALLSTTDPYITITDGYEYYGDIEAGAIPFADNAYAFSIADGVEDQHMVHFVLTINDDGVNTWTADYYLTLNAPVISCATEIEVDDYSGNGNGRLDEGETVQLIIPVHNTGHSASQNAMCTLTSASPYITFDESVLDIGAVTAEGEGTAVYTATMAPSIPDGTDIDFDFNAVAGMYSSECSFTETADAIIEDWETGTMESFDWTTTGSADWFTTTTQPYEGDYCMQSGNINDGQGTTLSLTLNVTQAGPLSFSYRVSSEADWDWLTFKKGNIDIEEWSGNVAWAQYSYPVTVGVHTFHWEYSKDFNTSSGSDAAWVDNIILPQFDNTVFAVHEFNPALTSFTLYPNPAAQVAALDFTLASNQHVTISLENNLGQQVMVMDAGPLSAGNHRLQLDVNALAAGLYIVKMNTGTYSSAQKLVKE